MALELRIQTAMEPLDNNLLKLRENKIISEGEPVLRGLKEGE